MNLQAQEVDSLRMISRFPIGTEIYRFKMEQYKELSTMRAEMEKIIQEQRLQRVRRNFEKKRREKDKEFENNKWVDDQRKCIIENRLMILEKSERRVTYMIQLKGQQSIRIMYWDYQGKQSYHNLFLQFLVIFNNQINQSQQPIILITSSSISFLNSGSAITCQQEIGREYWQDSIIWMDID
ncbi:unnamed protein product [Paramecium octaurelia]|uniref:Uncharacterized protein n=1 Tax=Paramecium octaurelia TaxID=43137 RepID=A0A8S1THG4_PAROT|nr:unnamed protein product [Paramecium octaurelia]